MQAQTTALLAAVEQAKAQSNQANTKLNSLMTQANAAGCPQALGQAIMTDLNGLSTGFTTCSATLQAAIAAAFASAITQVKLNSPSALGVAGALVVKKSSYATFVTRIISKAALKIYNLFFFFYRPQSLR